MLESLGRWITKWTMRIFVLGTLLLSAQVAQFISLYESNLSWQKEILSLQCQMLDLKLSQAQLPSQSSTDEEKDSSLFLKEKMEISRLQQNYLELDHHRKELNDSPFWRKGLLILTKADEKIYKATMKNYYWAIPLDEQSIPFIIIGGILGLAFYSLFARLLQKFFKACKRVLLKTADFEDSL